MVGENDIVHYMKDRVTHDRGFQSLTQPEDIIEWARVSTMTSVVKLHVYHDYLRSTTKEPPTTGKTTIRG